MAVKLISYLKGIGVRTYKSNTYAFGDYASTSLLEMTLKNTKFKKYPQQTFDAKENTSEFLINNIKHDIGKRFITIRNGEELSKETVKHMFEIKTTEKSLLIMSKTSHFGKREVPYNTMVVNCENINTKDMQDFLVLFLNVDLITAQAISKHLNGNIAHAVNLIRILKASSIPATTTNIKTITEQLYGEDFSLLLLSKNSDGIEKFLTNYDKALTVSILNTVFKRLTQLETLVTIENNKESIGWALNQGKVSQETVRTLSEYVPSYTLDVINKAFAALDQAYTFANNPDADALRWLQLSWPA